jgi:hypothetical protein
MFWTNGDCTLSELTKGRAIKVVKGKIGKDTGVGRLDRLIGEHAPNLIFGAAIIARVIAPECLPERIIV